MSKRLRRVLRLGAVVAAVPILVIGGHLGIAAWNDPDVPLPPTQPGRSDASRGSSAAPAEVVTVAPVLAEAESQLCALVRRAAANGRRIAIAGARHSMGGHTMLDDAIVVDTTPLAHVRIDAATRTVTAGAGASWRAIVPRLQREGLAVKVMQSNDDFTIGGSLAVNCHGWQQGLPPIASTVRSLRVVTAGGEVAVCTRDNEHRELFRYVLGGYGLFGIVTEATLDADGKFVIDGLTTTPVDLHVMARSWRGQASAGPFRQPEGGVVDDVELILAPPYEVTGSVVDAKGKAIPGAIVDLLEWTDVLGHKSAKHSVTLADRDGKFSFRGVYTGRFGLRASTDGHNPFAVDGPFAVDDQGVHDRHLQRR